MPPGVSQDLHMKTCVYWCCQKAFCIVLYIVILWDSLEFHGISEYNPQISPNFPKYYNISQHFPTSAKKFKTQIVEGLCRRVPACCLILGFRWLLKSCRMLLEDSVVVGPLLQRRVARQCKRDQKITPPKRLINP